LFLKRKKAKNGNEIYPVEKNTFAMPVRELEKILE